MPSRIGSIWRHGQQRVISLSGQDGRGSSVLITTTPPCQSRTLGLGSCHSASRLLGFNASTGRNQVKSTRPFVGKELGSKHFSISSKIASATRLHKPTETGSTDRGSISSGRARMKSILITGGTSGIGFAVAKRAVLEGAVHVRIVTRDARRGEAAVERLRKESSNEVVLDWVQAETSEYADSKIFHQSDATLTNKFTAVIHCAGITQTTLLTSTQASDIQKILTVNLESAALLSKSFLKRYVQTCTALSRQNSTGASIQDASAARTSTASPSWQFNTISSLLASKGGYGASIYAASKAGQIALTRTVALEAAAVTRRYAREGAPGFRANVVLPGYIETPMTKGISDASREELTQKNIPAARFGTPDEVADAVLFLVGNEYANNCVLNLDGGLNAT